MAVDLPQALAGLYARAPAGVHLGLDAMADACARAGHPERAFEVVHIAGTNGKGSVAAMVAAMAGAAGVAKVGLYTSPHLARFAERIRVNGTPVDDALLAESLDGALRLGPGLSFFEVATLAGFLAFQRAGVSLVVLEVGLGGRLDATNVVPPPRATAVTRIAFDHMDYLGPTLAHIAREKAGIAKADVPMVVGDVTGEAWTALEDEVRRRQGILVPVGREGPVGAGPWAPVVPRARALGAGPRGIPGRHQEGNAAVAAALGLVLGWPEAAVAEGLAEAWWPGRLETIRAGSATYLLDAAHNPDGAESLRAYLETEAPVAPEAQVLVFGALADKAWPAMLDLLAPLAAHRHYVVPRAGARAAAPVSALAARAPGSAHGSVFDALAAGARTPGVGRIVVAGSLYLVGEARSLLTGEAHLRDPAVAL